MIRKIENVAWGISALLLLGVILGFTVQAVRPYTFHFISPLAVTAGGAYVLNRIGRIVRLRDAAKANQALRQDGE